MTKESDLLGVLQQYREDFLACRELGQHTWVLDDSYYRQPNGFVQRELTCMRCTTVRKDVYVIHRHRLMPHGRQYIYPDGYLVKETIGVDQSRGLFRYEAFRRAINP